MTNSFDDYKPLSEDEIQTRLGIIKLDEAKIEKLSKGKSKKELVKIIKKMGYK